MRDSFPRGRFLTYAAAWLMMAVVTVLLCEGMVRLFPSWFELYLMDEGKCWFECLPGSEKGRPMAGTSCAWFQDCLTTGKVSLNAQGFRDLPWDHSRGYTLGLLGDSFVQGMELPGEATFTSLLGSLLSSRVMNSGFRGIGQEQELYYYRHFMRGEHPRTVLVFILVDNDILESSCELFTSVSPDEVDFCADKDGSLVSYKNNRVTAPENPSPSFWKALIKDKCFSCKVVSRMWFQHIWNPGVTAGSNRAKARFYFEVFRCPPSPAWERAWGITERALGDLKREVAQDGSRLVAVILPSPWEFFSVSSREFRRTYGYADKERRGLDLQYPFRRMKGMLQGLDIPYYEMSPDLLKYAREFAPSPPYLFYRCDLHFNPAGSFIAMNLTARFLLEQGLVEVPLPEKGKMLARIERNLHRSPREILGDEGYGQIYRFGKYRGISRIREVLQEN